MATRLDYDRLRTRIVDDGKKLKDVKGAFERYVNSKLAISYTAIELSKRIRRNGITNIYVNACHPGTTSTINFFYFAGSINFVILIISR
jgi:NAD(P)-dependent dehydrogenase (short-subunit alcohol dehydrogenase family)